MKKINLWLFMLLTLLFACNNNKYDILLFTGDKVDNHITPNMESRFNIVFNQYEGFCGEIQDSILGDFIFLMEDHFNRFGQDILSDEQIEKLKEEKIIALKFKKIPKEEFSLEEITEYLKSKYNSYDVSVKKSENTRTLENEDGTVLAEVKYVSIGIPGYIITIGNK